MINQGGVVSKYYNLAKCGKEVNVITKENK